MKKKKFKLKTLNGLFMYIVSFCNNYQFNGMNKIETIILHTECSIVVEKVYFTENNLDE